MSTAARLSVSLTFHAVYNKRRLLQPYPHRKEAHSEMPHFVEHRLLALKWRVYFGLVGICAVLAGCTAGPPHMSSASLYYEAACTPAEVISQSRLKLSTIGVGTTEPTAEGKASVFSTGVILERNGKQERQGRYRLVVQATEDTNKSKVAVQRVEGQSKGIRERKWYDDDHTALRPPSEQQIWDQVRTICPSKQQ